MRASLYLAHCTYYVSPLQYNPYSCDQLRLEYMRISSRLVEVSGKQDSAAKRDGVAMGVGLVLFWPALFLLAGNKGNPDELARLKGECDAIEICAIEKNWLYWIKGGKKGWITNIES